MVGVHFVGGWIGSLWIGLFGTSAVTSLITAGGPSNGLFYGGGLTQLLNQAKCSGFVTVWSFGIAYALGWVINKTIGFRVTEEAEVEGIDVAEHAESGYDFASGAGGGGGHSTGAFALAGIGTPAPAAPAAAQPAADEPDAAKVSG